MKKKHWLFVFLHLFMLVHDWPCTPTYLFHSGLPEIHHCFFPHRLIIYFQIYLLSSVNHHISIVHIRVHARYIEHISQRSTTTIPEKRYRSEGSGKEKGDRPRVRPGDTGTGGGGATNNSSRSSDSGGGGAGPILTSAGPKPGAGVAGAAAPAALPLSSSSPPSHHNRTDTATGQPTGGTSHASHAAPQHPSGASPQGSSQQWHNLPMRRSKWFDLLSPTDRVEAMRGVWGLLDYLMRDTDIDTEAEDEDEETVK